MWSIPAGLIIGGFFAVVWSNVHAAEQSAEESGDSSQS